MRKCAFVSMCVRALADLPVAGADVCVCVRIRITEGLELTRASCHYSYSCDTCQRYSGH